MSSVIKDSFTSSFPNWMPCISFSYLVALARTFSTMLTRSGESRHPFLVPDLKGKAFNLLLVRMVLAVGFSYITFTMLRYVPFIPNLLGIFYHEKMLYFVECSFCVF